MKQGWIQENSSEGGNLEEGVVIDRSDEAISGADSVGPTMTNEQIQAAAQAGFAMFSKVQGGKEVLP